MLDRLAAVVAGARYGNALVNLCAMQAKQTEELLAENDELRRINLDLGRACYNLCQGLITEINDPGTVPGDLVLDAASDWADQIARMEEHHV